MMTQNLSRKNHSGKSLTAVNTDPIKRKISLLMINLTIVKLIIKHNSILDRPATSALLRRLSDHFSYIFQLIQCCVIFNWKNKNQEENHSIWYFFQTSMIDWTLIVPLPLSKKFHTTSQLSGFGVWQYFAMTSKNFYFEMSLLKS